MEGTTDEFNAFDDEAVKSMGVIKIRFTGQQGFVKPFPQCLFERLCLFERRCVGTMREG
jgi:hypothetical protein